jgi:hypothetical protein
MVIHDAHTGDSGKQGIPGCAAGAPPGPQGSEGPAGPSQGCENPYLPVTAFMNPAAFPRLGPTQGEEHGPGQFFHQMVVGQLVLTPDRFVRHAAMDPADFGGIHRQVALTPQAGHAPQEDVSASPFFRTTGRTPDQAVLNSDVQDQARSILPFEEELPDPLTELVTRWSDRVSTLACIVVELGKRRHVAHAPPVPARSRLE